jgi:hypothetical protein
MRIVVQSQPRQIVCETLSQNTLHKNRAGGAAQGEGPQFKPQYHKTNKETKNLMTSYWRRTYSVLFDHRRNPSSSTIRKKLGPYFFFFFAIFLICLAHFFSPYFSILPHTPFLLFLFPTFDISSLHTTQLVVYSTPFFYYSHDFYPSAIHGNSTPSSTTELHPHT